MALAATDFSSRCWYWGWSHLWKRMGWIGRSLSWDSILYSHICLEAWCVSIYKENHDGEKNVDERMGILSTFVASLLCQSIKMALVAILSCCQLPPIPSLDQVITSHKTSQCTIEHCTGQARCIVWNLRARKNGRPNKSSPMILLLQQHDLDWVRGRDDSASFGTFWKAEVEFLGIASYMIYACSMVQV